MKLFTKILKKVVWSIFNIYSINLLFQFVNVVIPINLYTIGFSSIFGFIGVIFIIAWKFIL